MDIHFHEYWTLHVGDNDHFLCPLCGARKHALNVDYVATYQM